MAKQLGPHYITGTMGNVTYYELEGIYYARAKSSLDGKRVKRDPRFARTMAYAGLFATASRLAASAYRQLPKEKREHAFYRKLTGIAMQSLRDGKTEEEVKGLLALASEIQ
jgi:hypothetical protein